MTVTSVGTGEVLSLRLSFRVSVSPSLSPRYGLVGFSWGHGSPFKPAPVPWRAASSSASLPSESSDMQANLILSVLQSWDQPFLQGAKG